MHIYKMVGSLVLIGILSLIPIGVSFFYYILNVETYTNTLDMNILFSNYMSSYYWYYTIFGICLYIWIKIDMILVSTDPEKHKVTFLLFFVVAFSPISLMMVLFDIGNSCLDPRNRVNGKFQTKTRPLVKEFYRISNSMDNSLRYDDSKKAASEATKLNDKLKVLKKQLWDLGYDTSKLRT